MRTQFHGFILAALLVGATAAPAAAADCALKMVASVETRTDPSGAMLLPASFNGTEKLLLVDTGGAFHMLRPQVVRELGLTTRESQLVELHDALGAATSKVARVQGFTIGLMKTDAIDFVVMSDNGLLGNNSDIAGVFFPGLYSRALDVDLDFPAHKFNLMSQDHCPGTVVYWPNSGVAVVPFTFAGNHIMIPAKVDGHDLQAIVDTGASGTVMYTRVAGMMGVNVATSGDVAETGPLGNDAGTRTFQHRFRSLSIEGITINNPLIALIPDMNRRMPRGPSANGNDTRFASRDEAREDMLIGMSILKHLHVYIAYGEHKLYITAGSPQAAGAAQTPATGSAGQQPAQ